MQEYLIVLSAESGTEDQERIIAAIRAAKGKIVQRAVPRVILCLCDDPGSIRKLPGIAEFTDVALGNLDLLKLDESSRALVGGWNTRQSAGFKQSKALRIDDGKPWDFHGQRPGGTGLYKELSPLAGAPALAPATPTNTSQYLIGTVACGLVIVDGPGNAAFTQQEYDSGFAEVQEAFVNLVLLSPPGANLSFVIDLHHVTLADADTSDESVWIPGAIAAMGYSTTGWTGIYDYLHFLRTRCWPALSQGPDWAYLGFLTKYQASWFAYAYVGGPYLVMQYGNNGWGSGQIDRVWAHETGHIFRAPDEYGSSGCSIGGSYGYLGIPNDNCENNNPGSINCLMKGNTYAVCPSTFGHFGWRDLDSDGTPDPVDTTGGAYTVDVGIDPGSPFYDNADLWVRNQDDGEANQQHQSPRSDIDNFIYARVKNFGATKAEIVRARFYLAPYLGTEFQYPDDYTNVLTAPDTPYPTIFALAGGADAIAKVRLRQAQIPPQTWHTCLLTEVTSTQQALTPAGSMVWQTNNLAQKNLTIVYVAPGQTTTLPIMLRNLSPIRPFFKLVRDCPAAVATSIHFSDRQIQIETIRELPVFRPVVVVPRERAGASSPGAVGAGPRTLRFLEDSEVELGGGEVRLHLAAGSWMEFGMAGASVADEPQPAGVPTDIAGRIRLPIAGVAQAFRLGLKGRFARLAGLDITVPRDARLGERWQFEVQQFDEEGRLVGGVVVQVRVATRKLVLQERQLRTGILRHLAESANFSAAGDLADAADALIVQQLVADEGRSASVTRARLKFAELLAAAAGSRKWEVPVPVLAQSAVAMRAGTDSAMDLDVLESLLFHAQEAALVKFTM